MNSRELGIICALLAAMPNLVGCESSRSQSHDYQFEKQVKRAQECRQLQDKLIGEQPLTPKRGEEIANTLKVAGCTYGSRHTLVSRNVDRRLRREAAHGQVCSEPSRLGA